VTVDGPSTRKMLKLAEQADRKKLKVAVGLMCRHCDARKELLKRIEDGQIGDINLLRCYRQHGPVGYAFSGPKPQAISHLIYQISAGSSVEYTFADGARMFLEGRTMEGCHQEFASYAHGSKGSAVISSNSHSPARCRTYKGQSMTSKDSPLWAFPGEEPNP